MTCCSSNSSSYTQIKMNLNRHVDRVSKSVFIGSYEAITDPEVLKELSISKIISLDIEKPLVAQELKHLF